MAKHNLADVSMSLHDMDNFILLNSKRCMKYWTGVRVMAFDNTCNDISVILWLSVLLVEVLSKGISVLLLSRFEGTLVLQRLG